MTNEDVDLFLEHAIGHGRLAIQTQLIRYTDEHFGFHTNDLFVL